MSRTSIFNFELFEGMRPAVPRAGILAVATLIVVELLLRSGWVSFEIPEKEGTFRIPESILQARRAGGEPPIIQYSETCGYLMKPNYVGVYRGYEFENPLRLNNFGYHDDDFSIERAPGEFRIAVVGMSLTAAVQVRKAETWVSVLEEMLNGDVGKKRVNLMNFGVNGHFLSNIKPHIEHHVLRFSPDLIVLHIAERVIEGDELYKGTEYRGYALRYLTEPGLHGLKRKVDAELSSLQFVPIRYLALARVLCKLRGREPLLKTNLKQLNVVWGKLDLRSLEEIHEVCRRANVRLTVITSKGPSGGAEIPPQWFKDRGIVCVADSELIDVTDRRLFFKRDGHFNVGGNRRYAAALAPVFREWVARFGD